MKKKSYSQIRAMMAIAKASFSAIIKNPSAVIFSLIFPLVFIIVFGFIKGNSIRLDVGINPDCDTTSSVFSEFARVPNINIIRDKTHDQLNDRLLKGRMDAILHIYNEETRGEQTIEVITSLASGEKGELVKSILTNIINSEKLSSLEKWQKEIGQTDSSLRSSMQLRETIVQGREYKTIDFILPGQLGFSILSAGVFGTAFIFFSLRQTLVLKRFFATPIARPYIILGEAISRLSFSLLGSLIIILLGKYFFGFTLINGFQTLLQLLLLSGLGLIVFMGFGFVVSGIAKSESVIPPLANAVTLPQFLLSGTFFPVDAFPEWLQRVSNVLPLTYLNDAIRKVAFEGAGIASISSELLIILGWGVIIYAAAIRFFRWE